MNIRAKCVIFALFIFTCTATEPCLGQPGLVIHAKTPFSFELQGYAGLETISIYHGTLAAGESLNVKTQYTGLAMLIFSGGQKYPVLIHRKSSDMIIDSPDEPPSFTVGDENHLFYRLLSGENSADKGDGLAGLMIQGKELLDSSGSIQTVVELHDKKNEFQEFVRNNYPELSRSDFLSRFVGQYFMMHEYVRYQRQGEYAGTIRLRYQQEILAGVRSLLVLLQDNIPENKLLNYIVDLYYNRGMVTLASFIADNFREFAYCGKEKPELRDLPETLNLIHADGSAAGEAGAIKGVKTFAFVSADCPVSMVMTVVKAREAVAAKNPAANQSIIVVPLEKLSAKLRSINRNISGGTLLFVDDEQWRKKNLSKNMRLPFFVNIAGSRN